VQWLRIGQKARDTWILGPHVVILKIVSPKKMEEKFGDFDSNYLQKKFILTLVFKKKCRK
jgi:hypothetical protein